MLICFILFQFFISSKSYRQFLFQALPFVLVYLMAWYDNGSIINIFGNFYRKFEKNNQENFKVQNELAKILSNTSFGYTPRVSNVANNVMLNVKFVENENLFEFGNIKKPLTNAKSFKNFIKQMMLVYEFIDFIEKEKNS